MMEAGKLFSATDREAIHSAIRKAEEGTSGELRLFLEDHCASDTLDRASYIFEKLQIKSTGARNGVLIYIAVLDHRFCVIGDSGIHSRVGDAFWEEIRNKMQMQFKDGKLREGIIEAIEAVGKKFKVLFPQKSKDDSNELPDDIVFGL